MKISEVCERTGLTKRTVRFYEEKGLISPKTEYRSGRELREYSEEDIRLLKAVSMLRGLDISVEDIGLLIRGEVTAEALVNKYRSGIRTELVKTENIYNILSSLEAGSDDDIYSLAAKAERKAEGQKLPLRDIEPDFSGLEELTEEEKRQSFERFHTELVKKNAVSDYKRSVVKRVLLCVGAAVLIFLIVCGISWIPRSIDFKVAGTTYLGETENGTENYRDVLTVKGKVYKPLFFKDIFVGEIKLEYTPGMCFDTEFIISPDGSITAGTNENTYALYYDQDGDSSEIELRLPEKRNTFYDIVLSATGENSFVQYTYDELIEGSAVFRRKYSFVKCDE